MFRSIDGGQKASRLELMLIVVLVSAAIGIELCVRGARFLLRRKP